MRNRGSILLVENDKVKLIQRTKDETVYNVFPGSGIEHGKHRKQERKEKGGGL